MKEKIKKALTNYIPWIFFIFLMMLGSFAIADLNESTGCLYCVSPVETYDYGTDTSMRSMSLYYVHEEETAVYSLERLETEDGVEWTLCLEDVSTYNAYEVGGCPPSSFTSYYFVDVKYCPWCGRELED